MSDVLRESIYPSTLTTLAFYIAVLHPKDLNCKIPNVLILDHVTDDYTIQNGNSSPNLDSSFLKFNLGVQGVYRSINAVMEDRLLTFLLTKKSTTNNVEECEDTPYGFKLSEIINRVGNPLVVKADQVGTINSAGVDGWEDLAQINIYQKGYRIDRNNDVYFFFEFDITNIGTKIARQVIFKDILPDGVTPLKSTVKVDGNSYGDVNVTGRKLIVNLLDINPEESIKLTFLCKMSSCSCVNRTNVGCIGYLAWHAIKEPTCSKTIYITQITNVKSIDNCVNR